jgi:hypothetical protein
VYAINKEMISKVAGFINQRIRKEYTNYVEWERFNIGLSTFTTGNIKIKKNGIHIPVEGSSFPMGKGYDPDMDLKFGKIFLTISFRERNPGRVHYKKYKTGTRTGDSPRVDVPVGSGLSGNLKIHTRCRHGA